MTSVTQNITVQGDNNSITQAGDDHSVAISFGGAPVDLRPADKADGERRIAAIREAHYRSFISYCSDEIAVAQRFAGLIKTNAPRLTPVFFAEHSIAPRQNWYDELLAALDSIEFFFVIFSEQSFATHYWLHVESGIALARGKRIIPVLHGDINHNSLEFPYRLSQSALRLDEGDERLVSALYHLHSSV